MSGIIKVNSVSPDEIKNDILSFLESGGSPLSLQSYFAGSENAQLLNLIAGIWIQLTEKAENNRRDAFLLATSDISAIKYNAMSLLGYSPKQNIPSMHSKNSEDYLGFKSGEHFFDAGDEASYQIVGSIKIDNQNYNISLYKKIQNTPSYKDSGDLCYKCALGEWKKKVIELAPLYANFISNKFKMITISETKDIVDMNSLQLSFNTSPQNLNLKIVNSFKEINSLNSEDKARAVVAIPSYFGGVNFLFGDGQIYGSAYADIFSDSSIATELTARYFVSDGFINGLDFSDVVWDTNLISEDKEIYFKPLSAGINAENANNIRYNAILEFTSAGKICNADDLMAYLRGIPLVKSCWSFKAIPSDKNEWIPYAITDGLEIGVYSKGIVVNSSGTNYVCLTDDLKSDVSPENDPDNWMEVTNVVWQDNATLILYALVGKGIPHFNNRENYSLGEVVIHETNYWEAAEDIVVEGDAESEPPSLENNSWKLTEPKNWTSLTQAQWELEYASGLNINSKLGFLSVRVRPCTAVTKDYDIKVVRDFSAPATEADLINKIEKVLAEDWYELGRFFSAGRIVNACNNIPGISKFYLADSKNERLTNGNYFIKGNVDIKFYAEDDVAFGY